MGWQGAALPESIKSRAESKKRRHINATTALVVVNVKERILGVGGETN